MNVIELELYLKNFKFPISNFKINDIKLVIKKNKIKIKLFIKHSLLKNKLRLKII